MSDYLGTPIQMYDEQGSKIWDCTLDIYGKVIAISKGTEFDCPFRFQGQYADKETGLYYNHFRFYDSSSGNYLSQDPIGLEGENPTLYGYVHNTNIWIDILGLSLGGAHKNTDKQKGVKEANHMPSFSSLKKGKPGIMHGDGPATSMDILDHMNTASWGNRKTSQQWRSVQEDLIRRGKFGKAMEMDIRDVKRKFGNKYNDGMTEMINYAVSQGYITPAEGNRLKRKHLHH